MSKSSTWVLIFIAILTANIIGVHYNLRALEVITKPLLMMVLCGVVLFSGLSVTRSRMKWVLLGLIFSWAGDVLLLFQQGNSLFFMLGLVAFLIAHVFYIVYFSSVKRAEKISLKWWLLAGVVLYYLILIFILYPYLADMRIPVIIYGFVISTMLLLALHMQYIKNSVAGFRMLTGATLFVISDSILAFNKFYQPFEFAGLLIMLTYGIAQLMIVSGALRLETRGE